MPVLPIIDFLILLGWSSLMVGFAQKALWVATRYRPTLLGLSPGDFLILAAVCLLFALSLAARTWVKIYEPRLLGRGRARRVAPEEELEFGEFGEQREPAHGQAEASLPPAASARERGVTAGS